MTFTPSSPVITATTPSPSFKLEAVVVCDKYSDFLRHTLPQNKFLFDKLVVVTSHEDTATRKLCEFYHVQCVPTDALKSRHGVFCKGAGINEGLRALDGDSWVLHYDGDIWLPPQTRLLIEQAGLAQDMIYGIDRFIVKGATAWEQFLAQAQFSSAEIHESGMGFEVRLRK